jgi:myosin heavy subunit
VIFGKKEDKERAQSSHEKAVEAVDAAQREGVEVSALRVLCQGVAQRLAKRKYNEAFAKAKTIQRLTARLREDHRTATEALARLENLLSNLRDAGVDVAEGDAVLEEARALFEGEKQVKGIPIPTYGDAVKVASAAVEEYSRITQNLVKTRRTLSVFHDEVKAFQEEQDLIQAAALHERLLGEPLTTAEEAERRLDLGEHEAALELATEALETLRGRVEAARASLRRFADLREGLNALEAEEAPVADLKGELEDAERLLREGELDPADKTMAALETRLVETRDRYREVLQRIRDAEEALSRAKEWGFQTASQEAVIVAARRALARGRWQESEGLASRAQEEASSLQETHRELTEAIKELRLTAEAENVGRVIPIIEAADQAMMEGDYDRARAAIREVERRLLP